jgi:hypothetical protein
MTVTGMGWRVLLGLALLGAGTAPADAQAIPPGLPRYDLDIHLEIDHHVAHVRQVVTWTNCSCRATSELVFNAHAHFQLPKDQIGLTAKMLELLRMAPSEGLDTKGRALEVEKVFLLSPPGAAPQSVEHPLTAELGFHYQEQNDTALVVPLPRAVEPGAQVTVEVDFVFHLPPKQGRWGQWNGVTFLSNWLPVLAFYDAKGWQPTPFIPWHQPFFNEAAPYHARVTLPCDQRIACTGSILASRDVGDGLKEVEIAVSCARDFALLCSARYHDFTGHAGPVTVHVMAFAEHEHYAREMVRIACEAIPVYSRWFGPFPYPEFTIVESYFGWNGNECGGLVMIDERIFDLPHLALGFVESLVSHETCHQWWYNMIGTNGYCETWMDEAMATYFSHRLMDCKFGKQDRLLKLPSGLEWLPNIERQTYRYYGLYGTLGRGEATATVQDMPGFGHLVTLLSMCYDRGGKIVGMIEDRLGEAAFIDFMHIIYVKYHFRILRVADFQRELEIYTGHSWEEFFHNWLYGAGMSDWSVEEVKVEEKDQSAWSWLPLKRSCASPCRVTVLLWQKAEYTEQTVLGICLDGSESYQIRIPILPQVARLTLQDPPATVEILPEHRVRVEVELPCRPTQIAVDPDQVLVDRDPANNYWKPRVRLRLTPLASMLDETDLTTAYDRWNVIVGPWIYGAAYNDPWYTRSPMAGVRAGLYRTQSFDGGVYAAYRTDERDFAVGVEGLWDHWPWPHTQIGFNAERSLSGSVDERPTQRAVLFGRYVFLYGSSLYLPPIEYVETFGAYQENELPVPRREVPGAERFDETTSAGLHYHKDFLTPYWDPEGGYRFDATYAHGLQVLGEHKSFNQASAQLSYVQYLPGDVPWLSDTRVAARVYGAAALPKYGEFFPLGGGDLFRGYDLAERQGSLVWVASLEWRVPIARGLTYDLCDHIAGLRNIYGVLFYDVGDAYLSGNPLGGVAHAFGGGLRWDVTWFSIVEHTLLRLDVAKTINASTPFQIWIGIQHPF